MPRRAVQDRGPCHPETRPPAGRVAGPRARGAFHGRRRNHGALAGALGWLAIGLAAGCRPVATSVSAEVRAAESRPNVLLLTVDTLRADHLGCYGYDRPTSPSLDALADEGVLFERAVASSSWTLPTLAAVMTGHFSSTHACWKRRSRLSPAFETLPEVLRDAGYDTACVISHIFLARVYGLQQGFTHFDTGFDRTDQHGDTEVSSPRVSNAGIDWIENQAASKDAGPWLLWLHYFDPHFKYMPHGGNEARFGQEEPLDLYDGEVEFTDRHIGRVLDALERTGQAERTIVVLFADHGEEFGDHGGLYHGHTLHAELTRVPLILRAPGLESSRVAAPVRTVDLMPTILELAGIGAPDGLAGSSLVPAMRGEVPDLPGLAELRLGKDDQFESLVAGEWKLILDRNSGREQLYRISVDPGEREDFAAAEPERVASLRGQLRGLVSQAEAEAKRFEPVEELDLTDREQEALHGLGYAGDDDSDEDPHEDPEEPR